MANPSTSGTLQILWSEDGGDNHGELGEPHHTVFLDNVQLFVASQKELVDFGQDPELLKAALGDRAVGCDVQQMARTIGIYASPTRFRVILSDSQAAELALRNFEVMTVEGRPCLILEPTELIELGAYLSNMGIDGGLFPASVNNCIDISSQKWGAVVPLEAPVDALAGPHA